MPETSHSIIGGVVGVVLIGFIILISTSFSYLEYHEMGFRRQKSTGFIYTDKVYLGGRYLLGPDSTFKVYPASGQFVTLTDNSVFTLDKLQVHLDIHFQYFIRPAQLRWLHKNHEVDYDNVIKQRAQAALKDAAVQFKTEDFIQDRIRIEKTFYNAIRNRLGGECCQLECKTSKQGCISGCIQLTHCKEEQSGIYVDVRYFQLGTFTIPSDVYEKYLKSLTVTEDGLTENHLQDEAVVRKEIYQQVRSIENIINEVVNNATAAASLLQTRTQAQSKKLLEEAHSNGLKDLLSKLGLTDPNHKVSYHYMNTLQSMGKAYYAVDFSEMMLVGKP